MNILVTGGAGLIGSHICDVLVNQGHRVYCVDNLITSSYDNIKHHEGNDNFVFIEHDVSLGFDSVSDNFESVDQIYHLASPASPNHHSKISYHALAMETMMVNTQGTKHTLELAKKHNARYLYASTSEVYGDPEVHPQTEEYRGNVSTTGPRSVYDEAKRFGETLVAYYQRDLGLDTRIVRIFNTYGPRLSKDDMRMSVRFITQAIDGDTITVFGDGSQTRSLCFVDDMANGLISFMNHNDVSGEIINMGNPQEHTVLEYAEIIKRLTGSDSAIEKTEKLPIDDPKQRRPDISKAKALLGWEPSTSLEEGLRKTIEYYKQHS